MTKKYLGLAAGLLLLAGCTNNDFIDNGISPEGQKRTISTISASMGDADTRVQLKDGHQLLWNEVDVINVFTDEGRYHNYTLTSGAGTSSATFSGDEVTGSQFYALFCNTIFNLDHESEEVSMYWDSDAIFGKEGENINRFIPLFAKSSNANMQFKQLSGLLHFQVVGKGKLAYASLYGNNGEEFYNEYTLKYTSDDLELKPYELSTSLDHIGGRPNSDIELSEKYNTHIYFMLPAGMTFEKGFKLVVGFVDGNEVEKEVAKKYDESFTVKRGEVSTFPTISTTGDPTPEPENGWISNFFDLSGKNVDKYFYVFNDKVDWAFAFLLDDVSEEMPQDVIIIEFFTDYTSGTPDLSWLEGAEVHDLMASRLHGPDSNIYRIGDSSGFKMKKNTDGTWSMSIENGTVYDNNASSSVLMEDFYLKFRGNFVGEEPEPTESLIGDDGVINTALLPNGYGGYQYDMWHFNLTDDEKYTVSFLRYPDLEESTSAIPTGTGSYDFYVTDNGKRYRAGYVPVTIVKNGDGTYTISVTDVYLNGEDGEPDVSGVSMTWTGTLNSYDESNGGGTLTIGGENISATYSEAVFSEDGWHLYFTNFQFPSSISADIKEYVENIARMTIVLTGEVGATEYPTVPSYNGDEFAFQIVDTNGNLLWYSMSEGETENSLQIHEDDDYIIRMSGNAKSVDGLKTSTVFFDWTGAIPRRH